MARALVDVKIKSVAARVWIEHGGRMKRIGVEQLPMRTTRKHRFASRVVDGHSVGDRVVKAALKSNGRAGCDLASGHADSPRHLEHPQRFYTGGGPCDPTAGHDPRRIDTSPVAHDAR